MESGPSLIYDEGEEHDGSSTSVALTNNSDIFTGYLSGISDDQLSLGDESDETLVCQFDR